MENKLLTLTDEFRPKVEKLLANCKALGIEMVPYFCIRTPFEQGKMWRQSRSKTEIVAKMMALTNDNCHFLAHCIEVAGPQNGIHITDAIPGMSWHQWGEAVDCFWKVNGKAVWDTKLLINGRNGYAVYAEEAKKLGLNAGHLWSSFKDSPHVQLRKESSPAKIFTLAQIETTMQARFGNQEHV